MWHVVVTVAGENQSLETIREGLTTMARMHAFLERIRYAPDRAELCYWEEADDLQDAAALGLRLWGEHRRAAGLPRWEVVGLEVVDEVTHRSRGLATDFPTSTPMPF